jgi:hypothetical protein
MDDIVGIIIVFTGLCVLGAAAGLIGAVLAVVRPDHRNPVAYRWVRWYAHHSGTPPRPRV